MVFTLKLKGHPTFKLANAHDLLATVRTFLLSCLIFTKEPHLTFFSRPASPLLLIRLSSNLTFMPFSHTSISKQITLTLSESLTGFSRIILTHLDGRSISLTVPRGSPINPGQSLRIRNEGMPRGKEDGHGRGDLWVKCEVEKVGEDWAKGIDLVVSFPFEYWSCK